MKDVDTSSEIYQDVYRFLMIITIWTKYLFINYQISEYMYTSTQARLCKFKE